MPLDGTEFELPKVTRELMKARSRIEAGWIQRRGHDRDGVCMVFALSCPDFHLLNVCGRVLSEAIGYVLSQSTLPPANAPWPSVHPAWVSAMVMWNDAQGRTKEEVLAAYDRAIELSLCREGE